MESPCAVSDCVPRLGRTRLRRWLAVGFGAGAAALSLAHPLPDGLIAYEGFAYTPESNLATVAGAGAFNGGTGWGAGWATAQDRPDGARVRYGTLQYRDATGDRLEIAGRSVEASGAAGAMVLWRNLPQGLGGTVGTSLYVSLLAENVALPADPNDPDWGSLTLRFKTLFPTLAGLRLGTLFASVTPGSVASLAAFALAPRAGGLDLSLVGADGAPYALESSLNLVDWARLLQLFGTGETQTIVVPPAEIQFPMFFRLREDDQP